MGFCMAMFNDGIPNDPEVTPGGNGRVYWALLRRQVLKDRVPSCDNGMQGCCRRWHGASACRFPQNYLLWWGVLRPAPRRSLTRPRPKAGGSDGRPWHALGSKLLCIILPFTACNRFLLSTRPKMRSVRSCKEPASDAVEWRLAEQKWADVGWNWTIDLDLSTTSHDLKNVWCEAFEGLTDLW